MRARYAERIVCMTEETTETLYALGEEARIVGISGFTVRPSRARKEKPKVSAFTSARIDRILALEPDLVLGFSDLQADIAAELIHHGIAVHIFNQRSVEGIFTMMRMLGGLIGEQEKTGRYVERLRQGVEAVQSDVDPKARRPRVYFEEWDDPCISGIRWVSELIEMAGGRDIFTELREQPNASGRVVTPQEVARRNPHIILASWCGKPLDSAAIAGRAGWQEVDAVKAGRIYEIAGEDILSPGPSLLAGLRRIHEIVQEYQDR